MSAATTGSSYERDAKEMVANGAFTHEELRAILLEAAETLEGPRATITALSMVDSARKLREDPYGRN